MRQFLVSALTFIGLATLLLSSPNPAQAGLKLGKMLKMSKDQELSIANDMHEELAKDPGLVAKGKEFDLVQEVGKRLVSKNSLQQYDYKFYLTKDKEVNAFATPGGYIYVTQGLLKYMAYDKAMLAGVMAHELGHAKDRHVARGYEKLLQGSLGLGALGLILGEKNKDLVNILGGAGGVVLLKYNRDQEEWADRDGVELAYKAGYDAYGLMRSLECLEALYGSTDDVSTWLTNHPATKERIARTKSIAYAESGKKAGYMAIPKPPKDHPLAKLYGSTGTSMNDTTQPDDAKQEGAIGTAEKHKRGEKRSSPAR